MLSELALNRLKRIQEVRQQERTISRQQVSRYRSELSESKNRRLQQSKESKLFELEKTQQELIVEWQRALLENGRAHTILERDRQKTESSERSSEDEKIRYQRALKIEREKREKDNQQAESLKKMKIEVTKDFQKNAREEARAYAEKVNSSLNKRTERNKESPLKRENFLVRVTEETITNRNRKNVPVKATIIRHFDPIPREDLVMVKNDASIAAQEIYRRLWGNVMQELLNKRTMRLRGRRASQHMLSTSNSPASVAHLERHLKALETLDKQRRSKLSPAQGGTSTLRVTKQSAERIEMDFEEQFLSNSRQSTMEMNTDPLPRPFVVHGLISYPDSAAVMETATTFDRVDELSLRNSDMRTPNAVRSNHNRLINVSDFPAQQFIPWRSVPPLPNNTTSLLLSPSSPTTSEEEISIGKLSDVSASAALSPQTRAEREGEGEVDRPTISSALPEIPAKMDSRPGSVSRATDSIRTVNVPKVKTDTSFASAFSDKVDLSSKQQISEVIRANTIATQRKHDPMGLYYDASHEADRRVKVRREPYAIHEEASEFDQGFQVVDNLSEEKLLQQQIEMLRSRKVSQVMRESETSSKRRAEPQFQPPQPPALNDQVRERVAPAYDSIPHTQTLEQDRLQNPSSNFKAMKTSKEATTQQRVSKQGRVRSNDRDAIPRRKGTDKVHDSNPPVDRSVPINRSSSGASKEVDMAAEEAAVAAAKVFATSLSSSGARRQPNPQKGRDAKSHVADTWSQVQQPLNMQRNESEIAVSEDKSAELDLSATFLSSSSSSLSVDGYDRYFSDAIQSVHRITILDKSKAESRSSRRSISDSYPELSLLNSDPHERLPVEKIDTGTSQSEATSAFHGARDNYGVNVSSNDAGRRHSGRAATGRDSTAKAVAAAHAFSISLDEHARKEQTGDGVRLAPLDKGQSHNGTASQLLSPVSLNKHIHDSKRQVLRGSDEDLDLRGVVQSSSSSSSSSITSISNLSVDGYDKYLEDAIQSVPHSYSVDMFTTDTLHREVNSFDKRIIDNTNQRKVSIDKRQGHTDHPGGDSIVLTVTGRRHISGGSMGQVPSAEAVAAAHAFSVSIGHGEGPRNQKEKDGRLRSPENRPLQHESTGTLSQLKETRNRSVARDDNNLDLSVLSQTHRSSDFIVERHSGNFQDVIQNARHRSAVNTSDIGRNNRGAKDSFQDPNLPHHSLDMSSIEREKTGKKNPPRAAIDTWRDSPVKADSRGVSFAAISDPNTQGNTREAAAAAHAYSMSAGEGARRARRPQNDELVIADEDAGRQFRASKQDLVLDGAGKKTASLDPDTVAVSEDDSLELDLSTSLHDTSSRSSSSTFSIDSYDRYLQDAVQIIEKRASSVAAVSVSSDNNSRSRDAVKDAYHMSQSGDSMPKAASIKSSEDGQISTGKGSGTATPGLHTSSTPAELFSNKSVTDNLNVSLRGKYGNEKEEVNSVHDSSLLQHDYRTSLNRSNSETKSPRIGLEPNHSLDSLISSTTSGSVNSTSVATDKLLQQWEDLFATRISPKQNPVQEESKSFMIDSPTATVDRSNFPLISTRNSISSSEKDGELVVDNDTNVSRSSVSYHNSESENKALDGVESASKSQSRDTLFSSKDSDSTAELLRQWNELYSTSRVADRRDVVLTDELRMLSLESTVFSILKELQPPNPPSMPMRTSDDSFRHSLHPDSIKPVLSSSWNSSVAEILGSDFLLEHSDNGLQSLEKIRNDQSSGDLTKQTSLQYSEDSSRNVVSQVGVRDSSGSVSSSTAAEHSLYDRWNTLYKARMSGSIVNSAPIVPVATSNKSDISYNDSDMSSIIDRAGDNSHENLGRKNGDDGLIAIQNVGKESMLSFPRSQARDVTNSIQKDFDISDILSLEKNEGGSFAVAHSLSNIESSMYSFTGRASILDSSEALAAEDRHSSDQSNVSDDVSITDLLKRWQDRRAGSEILTEDPARHFGVNNIIARGEEGTFSTIRADMTRPLLPRFDDSVLSSTVDNEDDHHLEDLSLSDTLKLSSFSKSKGPRTLKSYDNPSPVDSKMSTSSLKDDFTGRELAYRIAGTSDNVSLRTFRSNKLEISNSFSYSRGVGNISAGSDSDAGSLSGRAMSLLDVSLVNTTATEQSILHKDTQAEDTSLYRGSVSNDVLRGGDYSPASTSIPHSSSYPSLSEALTRLPLRMQDLQDRINASQNSQLVASDLSSDFSDGPTPDFEIDLGESSDSLSTPLITKAGANIVMDTSLPSSSASSIDVGIRWEAVGTNHTKEGSARSSLNLSSRNDFSKSFDDESAEIQHALSDMRGKLLSSLAATATPIQRNSTSIDRSVNTLTEMEGWSVSNLMEQDASKVVREDIAESKGVDHTTSVQFRLYQPIPPTNLGSTNLADGAEATDSFEKIDYDLLLGLRGSEAKEPDSDSDNDVDILFRSTHPSAVAPSSLASEANASSGDAIQTFQPVSYMNGFLSGPSMNPSPNLSVRPVPNEFQSSDSESESRNRSRGTTSMSMSGSISNLSNYTLRGSPSLSAQPPSLRQNYAYTPPSSDILADFSVSSDLRVAETEAVPIDSIHSEEPVDYLARSVRM